MCSVNVRRHMYKCLGVDVQMHKILSSYCIYLLCTFASPSVLYLSDIVRALS